MNNERSLRGKNICFPCSIAMQINMTQMSNTQSLKIPTIEFARRVILPLGTAFWGNQATGFLGSHVFRLWGL